jgi:hypothetical protein
MTSSGLPRARHVTWSRAHVRIRTAVHELPTTRIRVSIHSEYQAQTTIEHVRSLGCVRGRLESSTIVLERELRGQCQSLRHTAGPVPCRTPTLRPATSNLFVREREGSTGDVFCSQVQRSCVFLF